MQKHEKQHQFRVQQHIFSLKTLGFFPTIVMLLYLLYFSLFIFILNMFQQTDDVTLDFTPWITLLMIHQKTREINSMECRQIWGLALSTGH